MRTRKRKLPVYIFETRGSQLILNVLKISAPRKSRNKLSTTLGENSRLKTKLSAHFLRQYSSVTRSLKWATPPNSGRLNHSPKMKSAGPVVPQKKRKPKLKHPNT